MIFKEYNQTDIINIKNQIDRLRACGIGVADLPQNLRDSVWKIVYCELKQNGSRQNTVSKAVDGVCQSNILKKMFGLPKDVFGKKYWNMYSPDSKIRQEKYSDLQLPFNYAQVECNSVYRAMIHHMITGADVPTDTVVDIFGKFGLAAALCAGGYKYKIVCLNEQNFYLYSLLQDVMRKPVKFYKMIDEERKYLEIKLADNEIKDIMKSQIQHLGQIKVLVYYGVRKNVGGQYSYESTGYTKEQIAKYIFICLCFAPEYWVETNLEVKNNKMVTGWLDDEKTYKKCVTDFVKLSQEDFVAFAKKFSELKFVNCDISRVNWSGIYSIFCVSCIIRCTGRTWKRWSVTCYFCFKIRCCNNTSSIYIKPYYRSSRSMACILDNRINNSGSIILYICPFKIKINEKESVICVQQQLIRQKIFIWEGHLIMNSHMAKK